MELIALAFEYICVGVGVALIGLITVVGYVAYIYDLNWDDYFEEDEV